MRKNRHQCDATIFPRHGLPHTCDRAASVTVFCHAWDPTLSYVLHYCSAHEKRATLPKPSLVSHRTVSKIASA